MGLETKKTVRMGTHLARTRRTLFCWRDGSFEAKKTPKTGVGGDAQQSWCERTVAFGADTGERTPERRRAGKNEQERRAEQRPSTRKRSKEMIRQDREDRAQATGKRP